MGSLRIHASVHTGEKPYDCKHCGKCFSKVGTLKSQERVHIREKPHECKQCSKCFSEAGSLKSHQRVHTGEKPYKCKYCGKCFGQRGSLKKHKDVHSGKTSLNCDSNKGPFKRLHCKRKRAGSNRRAGFTNTTLSQRETRNSGMEDQESGIIEKHSCWICQEEMSSESLLLQHYENHMTYVAEDVSES